MCGIGVVIDRDPRRAATALEIITQTQLHRGPDSQGCTIEQTTGGLGVGLASQRLAILDRSSAGAQPMVSADGRYVLVYNGEIYNYRELADDLGTDDTVTHSSGDTAVVLAAIARWGTTAFERFNGMWALALFDRREQRMVISRDRMGVKPLYFYAYEGRQLILASEMKSILAVVGRRDVNARVVTTYLTQGLLNIGAETFFEGVYSFPPASYAVLTLGDKVPQEVPGHRYWYHPFEVPQPESESREPSATDLRDVLVDSVSLRLRSDVRVGILLSGGLDSSSILAAACRTNGGDNLTALTVGSRDPASDETPLATAMASYAGVPLERIDVDEDPVVLFDGLSDACWYNDQPFLSMSAVAHREVMRKAGELGITVLLSGQGADEQLAGYNKFLYFLLYHQLVQHRWSGAAATLSGCLRRGTVLPEFRLNEGKRYLGRIGRLGTRSPLGPNAVHGPTIAVGPGRSYQHREWLDITRLSVPALLHYEDRMSMSWSRELRTPFMDYRLVELLARVPPERKIRGGWTKAILREAMDGLLPSDIQWQQRKRGFTLPEASWLRGPARDRIHRTLLEDETLSAQMGLTNGPRARKVVTDFLDGRGMVSFKQVFSLLCLETWLRRFEPLLRSP